MSGVIHSGVPYTCESLIIFMDAAECNFCLDSLDNATSENRVIKMFVVLRMNEDEPNLPVG